MSVQICEGIWRNRCGQRLVIIRCDPVDGQQWTDGIHSYYDNGQYNYDRDQSGQDLVAFVGLLPDKSQGDQTAEIDRLRSENERLQAEIDRLRAEMQQSEARNTADAEAAEYAARLEGLLDNSRDALRDLQEDHTAMDHRAEGARLAFMDVIKALWEMRR